MTTLTAPPFRPLELPPVPLLGRTFADYVRLFALDPATLRRRGVLDVGAGASSFTAEAVRRDIDAVAVDPLYGHAVGDLAAQARADYRRMTASVRARPASVRRPSAALAAREADRRAAVTRFLADYEGNARHGRYVRASLPALPFLDQGFSLVLCSHLLFLHPARFDYAWHLAACLELVRVTAGEARIHPLGGRRAYVELERLRGDLAAQGIRSDVVPVDDGRPARGDRMLVLRRDRALRRAGAP